MISFPLLVYPIVSDFSCLLFIPNPQSPVLQLLWLGIGSLVSWAYNLCSNTAVCTVQILFRPLTGKGSGELM